MIAKATTDSELFDAFRAGRPARLDGAQVYGAEVLGTGFDRLQQDHAYKLLSTHDRLKGDKFLPSPLSIAEMCRRLAASGNAGLALTGADRRALYGVIASRRIFGRDAVRGALASIHAKQFGFLWLGLSPGGLHCDYFDNVLCQLSGYKQLVVYDAELSDRISPNHYLQMSSGRPVNQISLDELAQLPSYRLTLGPGDAVAIPCAAYHSAEAQTWDSVSINTFFTPRARQSIRSPYARKENRIPWMLTNVAILASRASWRFCDRPLLRTGHYEVL